MCVLAPRAAADLNVRWSKSESGQGAHVLNGEQMSLPIIRNRPGTGNRTSVYFASILVIIAKSGPFFQNRLRWPPRPMALLEICRKAAHPLLC